MSAPAAWDGLDFSTDFRVRTLNGAIPFTFACLSFGLLFLNWSVKRACKVVKGRTRQCQHQITGSPAEVASDSHDLMLEAENAVIRAQVREQGIVWPGAFKALGMLKEKEHHHLRPNRTPAKHLAVPGGGQMHDSNSWIQWWKAPRKKMEKQFRLFGSSHRSRKGRRRAWTWKALGQKLVKQGKKDFIQALLAWGVVATVITKAIFMKDVHIVWKWAAAIAWTYFTLLLEVRQYTALLHRSPFRTRKYDRLTLHVAPFMMVMTIISFLELRSVVLKHRNNEELLGLQITTTALSLSILLMELLTPRPSNFIRKSTILEERAREASEANGLSRSPSSLSNHDYEDGEEENDSLLPRSHRHFMEDSSDEDIDDEDEMLVALDLMPDDNSISELKEKERETTVKSPPEIGASIFSLATFTYVGPFLYKHACTTAKLDDVPDLRADDKSASVVLEFRAACKTYPRWLLRRDQFRMQKRPSISLQICWYLWPQLVTLFTWQFLKSCLSILPPVFINLVLNWTTARQHNSDEKIHVAALFVIGLFCAQVAASTFNSQAMVIGRRMCIRTKALVIAEVFTKTLRRKDLAGKALYHGERDPKDAKAATDGQTASSGRIQNLVSVDASRIAEVFAYIHFLIPEAPITIILAVGMLFKLIGFSAFAAVGTMLCLTPYQSTVARLFMRYQTQVLNAADARLTLTTEVFQNIKVLKFFAWEKKFAEKLAERREIELQALRKSAIVFAFGAAGQFGVPILVALVTFLFHTKILHQPLDAATAFTSLTLFNIIRAPLERLTDIASRLIAAFLSCTRIDSLLEEEETAKYATVAEPSIASEPKIGFVNAALTWADADSALDDTTTFILKNLNLNFFVDGLNLVVGPVGSGKSSLLYALLGEMNLLQGRCFLPSPRVREAGVDPGKELTDTVAFCPQTPWLLNDTIRNNILFGSAYNAKRYKRVLYACALIPDLETLEMSDRTEVGEKGTVLSGGQKARISLARAVYSSAKVILLDDVLSAVDAHTARHLYNNCLTSEKLMRGRTRILVTHTLHLTLRCADYMVALANGCVVFDGPAVDYVVASDANTPGLATGQDFSGLTFREVQRTQNVPVPIDIVGNGTAEETPDSATSLLDEDALVQAPLSSPADKFERATTGAVSFGVYTFYGEAFGSLPIIISMIAIITTAEAVAVGTNWALRLWASSFDNMVCTVGSSMMGSVYLAREQVNPSTVKAIIDREPDYYLERYAVLAVLSLLLYGIRMFYFLFRGTVASRVIYNSVIKTLLAAPVRFYDQTPNGRIMNRLSSDMETIDQLVPKELMWLALELFSMGSVIVAIAIALPTFLIAGVFLSMVYVLIGWLFISSSRELKRIEAVTRSPVYSLVGESLLGVTSIRAYSDSSRFTGKLLKLLDDTNRPFFSLCMVTRWLAARSELGGACFAFLTGLFIVLTPGVNASLAGFALTYALVMEGRIFWAVRHYADTQMAMNAVERVREYTVELLQEPQGGVEPPAHWPSHNSGIVVKDLVVRYAEDLQPVLKAVSFDVKPSERVAIVGRTGSGKSTLALSFFRFVEAYKGKIIVDGINIVSMPLYTLRSRLTIIPQDAALFSGTVRFNLDPFDQSSDTDLYDVLRRTGLLNTRNASSQHETAPGTPTGSVTGGDQVDSRTTKTSGVTSLDDHVQEGAKNFSAGQRQLLCLARGLLKLRESNVLVLDESTANLDHEADLLVQRAIREEIGDKSVTVLCIAHRLHTIIDFDRVLVLSQGEVVEYDTPSNLLSKGSSEFAKLCKETGEFDRLKEIADRKEQSQARPDSGRIV